MGERVGFNPAWMIYKELILCGTQAGNRGELETVLGLVAAGKIRPVLFRRVGLHEVAESHTILERRGAIGRVVIVPGLTTGGPP